MNQCDGCQAGLPLENGMHIDKTPGGKFMCTKEKYYEDLEKKEERLKIATCEFLLYKLGIEGKPSVEMFDFVFKVTKEDLGWWKKGKISFWVKWI